VICVVETQKGAVDVEIWQTGTLAKLIASPGEDWKAIAATPPATAAATVPPAAMPPTPGRVRISPAARWLEQRNVAVPIGERFLAELDRVLQQPEVLA
jgi:hypothetical protein